MEALIERIAQEEEEKQQEKLQPKQNIAFSAQSQNLASIVGFLGQTEAQSVQEVMTTGMCVAYLGWEQCALLGLFFRSFDVSSQTSHTYTRRREAESRHGYH